MSVDYSKMVHGDTFEHNGNTWKVVDISLDEEIVTVSASLLKDENCFECFEFKIG